jgi:hypothetical protein
MKNLMFILLLLLLSSCGKSQSIFWLNYPCFPAEIETLSPFYSTLASDGSAVVHISGAVTNDFGHKSIEFGFCYSTINSVPTIDDDKYIMGIYDSDTLFDAVIFHLSNYTDYYFRAYTITQCGVSYGETLMLTTDAALGYPELEITSISNITTSSARVNVSITDDGGSAITQYGIKYKKIDETTYTDVNYSGSSTGFYVDLSGLTEGATYYVYAYAINSSYTSSTSVVSFNTNSTSATIPTMHASVGDVWGVIAAVYGSVTNNGGATVTGWGACYNTTGNPTIASDTATNVSGSTSGFICTLTGLTPGETYYVKIYGRNFAGIGYSSQVSFTTTSETATIPTVSTTAAYDITTNSAKAGGYVSSDGGSPLLEVGVCWTNIALYPPDILDNKTSDGTQLGSFVSNMSGLAEESNYYFRAFATNAVGTAYGSKLSFTTLAASSDHTIFVPDGFSPNNDGIFDYFVVTNLNYYPTHKMSIFALSAFSYGGGSVSKGTKLYERTNDYDTHPWDGKYNGYDCPETHYVWILQINGSTYDNGTVLIQR